MSKYLFNFIYLLIFIFLFSSSNQESPKYYPNSQVKIYSMDKPYIFGDPFDDDTEMNTTDRNCNETEYPEQARRCDNKTMVCLDKKRLHHCSCKEGYITFPDTDDFKYCNFKQKKQLIAFLLELCVGFGAGHFYRYEFVMASLKLVAFALGLVFICTFPIAAKAITDCDCDALAIILSIFYYLYLCGLAVWYIWDLVHFGNNSYYDYTYKYHGDIKEGIPLQPW